MSKLISLVRVLFLRLIARFKGGVWLARKLGVNIGDDCRVYTHSFGSEPFLITIGNKVTITSGVRILTHDGATWLIENNQGFRYQKYGGVLIGNNVFVGINSIIMPNVEVGNDVVIGAGSVVTKSVPGNSVVAGNPAKYICSFEDYKAKVIESCVDNSLINHISDYESRVFHCIDLQKERKKID